MKYAARSAVDGQLRFILDSASEPPVDDEELIYEEVSDDYRAPSVQFSNSKREIYTRILALEHSQARPLRELALSGKKSPEAIASLKRIDDEIVALRSQL